MAATAVIAAGPDRLGVHRERLKSARKVDGERLAIGTTAVAVILLPFAYPTGPSNLAPIDAFVLLAIGTCFLWAVRARVRCRFPYGVAMSLMLVGGAVGAMFGPVPTQGLIALVQDCLLFMWCWAIVNIGRSAANLRVLLTAWAYAGIAWAIVAFVGLATGSTVLTGQIARQGSRVQITLNDPSYCANYFFITLMIIWATRRPRHRLVRCAAYLLLAAGIVSTGSNSGMVALISGSILSAILGTYRRYGAMPAVAFLTSIVLVAAFLATNVSLSAIQEKASQSPYPFLRDGIGRSPQSADQRGMLVGESIGLYSRGSLVGEGPVSTKSRLTAENALLVKEAHDDYFAALMERGPIGVIGILVLVAGVLVRGLSLTKFRLEEGYADILVRPNALVGALVGTMMAMTVYELLHVRHVWALFALVAALSIHGIRRRRA